MTIKMSAHNERFGASGRQWGEIKITTMKRVTFIFLTILMFGQIFGQTDNNEKTIDSVYVKKDDIQGVLSPEIAVDNFRPRPAYRQWKLTGGYQFNTYEKKKSNHIIELGVAKVSDAGGIEPVGFTYYFANEILFNSRKFSIGPKLGGNIYFWGVALGSEIVYYTDFYDNTLHWVPFGGFGIGAGRLFLAGHIPFYNKHYPVNAFSIGLTMPIFNLTRKKILSVDSAVDNLKTKK